MLPAGTLSMRPSAPLRVRSSPSGALPVFSPPGGHVMQVLADGQLIGLRNRRYGRTVIGLYVNRPSGRLDMQPWSEEFVSL